MNTKKESLVDVQNKPETGLSYKKCIFTKYNNNNNKNNNNNNKNNNNNHNNNNNTKIIITNSYNNKL